MTPLAKAYHIDRAGQLTEHEIPGDGLKVGGPEPDHVRLERGCEDAYFQLMLELHCCDLARRIAPFAEFWFAPYVRHPDGERCGGLCIHSSSVVVVSSSATPSFLVSNLFHECYHAVDTFLLPQARAVLDAAVARGPWYPTDYLRDASERRARLFASFAMFLFEGGTAAVVPETPDVHLLWRIYSGELGAEIVAGTGGFDDVAA